MDYQNLIAKLDRLELTVMEMAALGTARVECIQRLAAAFATGDVEEMFEVLTEFDKAEPGAITDIIKECAL
jgi:hypothetical protein